MADWPRVPLVLSKVNSAQLAVGKILGIRKIAVGAAALGTTTPSTQKDVPRRHHRDAQKTATRETTYDASRRFFFFDDFFSFFFDDGTGVSSGFRFPATCTNAPDAGAAPAAVPKRCALASSIA